MGDVGFVFKQDWLDGATLADEVAYGKLWNKDGVKVLEARIGDRTYWIRVPNEMATVSEAARWAWLEPDGAPALTLQVDQAWHIRLQPEAKQKVLLSAWSEAPNYFGVRNFALVKGMTLAEARALRSLLDEAISVLERGERRRKEQSNATLDR